MSVGRVIRGGLLVLGVPQGAIGAWALLAPRDWYDNFPGAGREWLAEFGPYNEHFAADAGSGLVAASVLVLLAAYNFERRVVQVALMGWPAFAIPHTIYHVTAYDALEGVDNVINYVVLGITTAVPLALLALTPRLGRHQRARLPT